ncbi:MAG: neutral zinc metallopeptidase [Steroidobacteraceae bacterium]
MRWRGERESSNVEDRRGMRVSRGAGIGGVGGIVLGLLALYFTKDPTLLLQSLTGGGETTEQSSGPYQESAAEAENSSLTRVVLASTEDVWGEIFTQAGQQYAKPTLVLFSGSDTSACGAAQAAMGPFYCPGDQKVYIDLSFYDELKQRFGAPGEFAQAYVVAHEVGHHVQNLLGISDKVQQAQRRLSETEGNAMSVRLELQADCYAGVWAFHADQTRHLLEAGDVEAALTAANAIGDDRLQKQATGQVVPDSFTHGSSEQRMRWFKRGIDSGDVQQCDTFKARSI